MARDLRPERAPRDHGEVRLADTPGPLPLARRGPPLRSELNEGSADGEVRAARPADAEAIAEIQNQGISERVATFETVPRQPGAISDAIAHWAVCLVFERDGEILGFAKISPYEDRSHYYDRVGEATVYVDSAARGGGIGKALLEGLAEGARARGLHKLTAKIFARNEASRALFAACGFREVGVHHRHGELDGEWLDVVVIERSL